MSAYTEDRYPQTSKQRVAYIVPNIEKMIIQTRMAMKGMALDRNKIIMMMMNIRMDFLVHT